MDVNGKHFAADFERIDDVKPNDKFLVEDSGDGRVKYATPSQINKKFDQLQADIDTAVEAASQASIANAQAQQAKDDAATSERNAQQSETNAEDSAQEAKAQADSIKGSVDEIDRLKRDLGYNATSSTIALQLGVSGKYVKCATRSAASNAQFAISKPIDIEACSELLIKTGFNPSDAAHKGLDISVIAIYEEMERQRTVQKKDGNGNPLFYVTEADEEGNITVTEQETTVDTGYPVYVVETYTEYRYLPNNEDRFVAIPDSGYYVANIPQSCKVVISYKPGVTDMNVIVVKHGALANLTSQLFGIFEHRTMVEAVVSLAMRVSALEGSRGLLGNATAGTLDVSQITKCKTPLTLYGHGVPSAATPPENWPDELPWDVVPMFTGQQYIDLDASSSGLYYAKGHDSAADWKQA